MRILFVCTANICRSPAAQQLLRQSLAAPPPLNGVEVLSAGTSAVAGATGCVLAPGLAGLSAAHRARPLTAELVDRADLVLAAARDNAQAALEVDPAARSRTFTVRQAGRIADWLVDSGVIEAGWRRSVMSEPAAWLARLPAGDPRWDVPPMPVAAEQRWAWLVAEMDAARGIAGAPGAPEVVRVPRRGPHPRRLLRLRGRQATQPSAADGVPAAWVDDVGPIRVHPDDVVDPHVFGMDLHEAAHEQIRSATDALARLLRAVARSEVPGTRSLPGGDGIT